jgi:hypothetical protein
MRKPTIALLAATALLAGCAKPMKYDWGGYDSGLYGYYKSPASADNFRVSLEEQVKAVEGRKMRPAPGIYAEIGTLYLEKGDRTTAATYYQKERDAWPESRYLMETLLKSLERMSVKPKPQAQTQ